MGSRKSTPHRGHQSIGPRSPETHSAREEHDLRSACRGEAGHGQAVFSSRLELRRSQKQPSVETVFATSRRPLSKCSVGWLFGEQTTERYGCRTPAAPHRTQPDPTRLAVKKLRIVDAQRRSLMEGFLFEAGSGILSAADSNTSGEEMFFVLSGMVEMRTPDRSYVRRRPAIFAPIFPRPSRAFAAAGIGATPAKAIPIVMVARTERSQYRAINRVPELSRSCWPAMWRCVGIAADAQAFRRKETED